MTKINRVTNTIISAEEAKLRADLKAAQQRLLEARSESKPDEARIEALMQEIKSIAITLAFMF